MTPKELREIAAGIFYSTDEDRCSYKTERTAALACETLADVLEWAITPNERCGRKIADSLCALGYEYARSDVRAIIERGGK